MPDHVAGFRRGKIQRVHPDHIARFIAEHPRERLVGLEDDALFVDGYPLERRLREPPETFLALAELLLGPPAPGFLLDGLAGETEIRRDLGKESDLLLVKGIRTVGMDIEHAENVVAVDHRRGRRRRETPLHGGLPPGRKPWIFGHVPAYVRPPRADCRAGRAHPGFALIPGDRDLIEIVRALARRDELQDSRCRGHRD